MGTRPPLQKGRSPLPSFRPISIVAKRLDASKCHLVVGMEVGLCPSNFVFDGDPAPPPRKVRGAPSAIFGPFLLWPNGWMDQGGILQGGGPWSRPHCARWGPIFPSPKTGQSPQVFGPFLLWPNGWMHQDATWCGGRPQPRRLY